MKEEFGADRCLCFMPFRNRRRILPNRNAKRISNAPALSGLESIPQPRRFEDSAHLPQFFRPAFPGSNPDAPATRRYFSRTGFGADIFGACAQASPNAVEKGRGETRGFTSCCGFSKVRKYQMLRACHLFSDKPMLISMQDRFGN